MSITTGDHPPLRDSYVEHAPPAHAKRLLSCVWARTVTGERPPVLVVPDGCVDVIFSGGALWVAGPDTHRHLSHTRGTLIGARFVPGAAPAALGIPAHQLRDSRIDLADIWPAGRVRGLADRLAEAGAQASTVLAGALPAAPDPDPVAPAVRALITRRRPVTEIAHAVGFTERQLHRRCVDAFGYGPKTLARVLRFQRALRRARTGLPLARVATDCGYADQAHLAREVRALSGTTLTALCSS